MADAKGKGWLAGLLGAKDEAPRFAADPLRGDVRGALEALADVESRAGAAIVRAALDAPALLARARGLALTGGRVAVLLPAGASRSCASGLRALVDRRVSLVVHAVVRSTAEIDELAASGALVGVARDPRHALDLALVARRAAEAALWPVVVALDEESVAEAWADLDLPPDELLREYLGRPEEAIETPTPEQRMLFGESRRRLPRWFDPCRPLALGLEIGPAERAAVAAGREIFAASSLAEALDGAAAAFARLTGRDAGRVNSLGPADAPSVVVASGPAAEVAAAVAAHERGGRRPRVAVIGLGWIRPLDEAALSRALAQASRVAVLAGDAPDGVVARAVRGARQTGVLVATHDGLAAADVALVLDELASRGEPRALLRLGIGSPAAGSDFPKREAVLQRVAREYPELARSAAGRGRALDLRPAGASTLVVRLAGDELPRSSVAALVAALRERRGPYLRSRTVRVAPGTWRATVTVAATPLPDPGARPPVDLLLVADLAALRDTGELTRVAAGGAVVVASTLDAAALGAALPAAWRESAASRELRLYRVPRDEEVPIEPLGRALVALLDGRSEDLEPLPAFERRSAPDAESEPPWVVRRLGNDDRSASGVARFFSEYAEPRAGGDRGADVPDPCLAAGLAPVASASFDDASAGRETVPVLDPARCTGCGRCWTVCPDSAIGVAAVGTAALLDLAEARARSREESSPTDAAAALRRAHKQLAGRIDSLLAAGAPLSADTLDGASAWLVDRLGRPPEERAALEHAFGTTRRELERLPLVVTTPFFHDPHAALKASGELLLVAFDPRACQGCGLCAAECPEQAIRDEPVTPERVSRLDEGWRAWAEAPDTTGATIARAGADARVGPLAALLMSRHCALTVTGGGRAEPGSGERIALRQVAAGVEYELQRRALERERRLEALEGRLGDAVREELARAVRVEDLGRLDAAVLETARRGGGPAEVVARLGELGERVDLDLARLHRLAELGRDVAALHAVRARYGVVLAGGFATDWAASFPFHPFTVPVIADRESGLDVALGLAEGLRAARVDEERLLARAAAEAGATTPPAARPPASPLVAFVAVDAGASAAVPGLTRVLDSGLPVKVVLLDGRDLRFDGVDATLLGLAHRAAAVAATSIAHPAHLAAAVEAALGHDGPALLHVHAPSPRRHGFSPRATVERARAAVDSRVHPLLRYDPAGEGVFGLRIDLAGNPDPASAWSRDADGRERTVARWADGERRFQDPNLPSVARGAVSTTVPGPNGDGLAPGGNFERACARRAEIWATLQELAGLVTPFTERVRARLAAELAAERAGEIEAVRREHEARIAAIERGQRAAEAERLRRRLLELAGYGEGRTP